MKLAMVVLTRGTVSGGVAKHLHHVVPLLLRDPRIVALRVFAPEGAVADAPADWPLVEWPVSEGVGGRRFLKAKLAEFAPDVVFTPSARWLATDGARTVVMVRNMEPLETPFAGNGVKERLTNLARRFAARRACRRADRVIAVSCHVRDYLLSRWSVSKDKVAVVYHGIENPPDPSRPASLAVLPDAPFMFTAGSIRPARGLTDLVAAMADERVPDNLHLVVAGRVDGGAEHYHRKVLDLADRLGVSARIHWAGQLNPSQMSWGFRNSRLFVTTSRAEACPNTVLEAMRHGALSVSGDNPPMPEFFAESAIYYEIGNARSLAAAIAHTIALPEAEETRLRDLSRARSIRYTWERTAAETLSALLELDR